jgi:hypothetical protein
VVRVVLCFGATKLAISIRGVPEGLVRGSRDAYDLKTTVICWRLALLLVVS